MIEPANVQDLIARWWFNYDEANFDLWPELLTDDAHFTCRSDTGQTDYEEFIRADVSGKQAFLDWQVDHRRNSPYPLRHNGTNVHLTGRSENEATFSSYIFVTQIVGGAVANLSSGLCTGIVREEGGVLKLAELNVVLDTQDSDVLTTVRAGS